MIKLGECELDYPTITRFKVWVGKEYMGEYDKGELVKKFGERANGNETGGWIKGLNNIPDRVYLV